MIPSAVGVAMQVWQARQMEGQAASPTIGATLALYSADCSLTEPAWDNLPLSTAALAHYARL